MNLIRVLQTIPIWISAVILAVLPFLIGADYGGILRWTQLASAYAVILAVVLAATGAIGPLAPTNYKQNILLVPIILWIGYSIFQTVPLSAGVVAKLSPGSHEAYTSWLKDVIPDEDLPDRFPISIAVHASRHVIAMMAITFGLVFAATNVFHTRPRIAFLLNACVVGAACHAVYGLLRIAMPDGAAYLMDEILDQAKGSFGSFINRNNAALLMNIGVGCSVGVLAWRLMALSGQEFDDDQFEFNDLASLISDRESMLAIAGAIICCGGLLVCGSRGGLVSLIAGLLMAFGWVRQRRGLMTLPVVGVSLGIAVVILLAPASLKSATTFRGLSHGDGPVEERILHWPEGFAAAIAHLPAGSGPSTYGYAYLPHQKAGAFGWAHHADNLWLELFAEQGFIGILLALLILGICSRSLLRLRHSPDPIDQGLRTAGWYILAVIVVSQVFDFGMILPSNLFLVLVLMSAIISREVGMRELIDLEVDRYGQDTNEPPPTKKSIFRDAKNAPPLFTRSKTTLIQLACAVVAIAATCASMNQLQRSAEVETLVRNSEYEIRSIATDPQALKDWSQVLTKALGDDPEPELLDALAKVEHRRARLGEVIARAPTTKSESSDFYRQTNQANRRIRPLGNDPKSQQIRAAYKVPQEIFADSLRSLPLGFHNRAGQLYLDFLEPNPARTRLLIEQLHTLHHNKPVASVLLGQYAADSKEPDLAARIWRATIQHNPRRTHQVVQLSKNYDNIQIEDIVPDNPINIRQAAQRLLETNDSECANYLPIALDGVACEECELLKEKSACLSLRGDIAHKLGKYNLAFNEYREAIECAPTDGELRLKLIRRLRERGEYESALVEARRARFVLANDERFDDIIATMADEDVERVRKQKAERARLRKLQQQQ